MEIKNEEKFIRGVESLIVPMKVSDLLFFQKLKGLLPRFLLTKLLHRASRKTPHIGFVIEPYSLFLFFKLKDLDAARAMLPDRYELSKTRLFEGDEPEHYMGIGNLGTRASTFWGTRLECYLIAKDRHTGIMSFIFIDILSNTLIALPKKGIANPNCESAMFTTSARGEVHLDIREKNSSRLLKLHGSIKGGSLRTLDQPLWLMGNTSIGHSRKIAQGEDHPFAVIFDPAEVAEALDIPSGNIRIMENTLFPGLAEAEAHKVVCFPYAQHFIADSPGCFTSVKDRDDLVAKYNEIGGSGKFKTFSAMTIVREVSILVAAIVLVTLLLNFLI